MQECMPYTYIGNVCVCIGAQMSMPYTCNIGTKKYTFVCESVGVCP